MAKYGMSMPGGSGRAAAGPDVYTGLLFAAVLVLGAACGLLWVNGSKLAPNGMPLEVQGDRVQLPS